MFSKFGKFLTALQSNGWYALGLLILAIVSLTLLIYELVSDLDPSTLELLDNFDLWVAYIFLIDFCLGLFFNLRHTKKEYLRHNWLNLVSSIPVSLDLMQALRILRALRAIRVVRASLNVWFANRHFKQR